MNENLQNAHSALRVCDEKIFSIVRKFLLILVTLPVTTATPERTFPTLPSQNLFSKYHRRVSLKWISNDKYSSRY